VFLKHSFFVAEKVRMIYNHTKWGIMHHNLKRLFLDSRNRIGDVKWENSLY
jgi:hypothetical protein